MPASPAGMRTAAAGGVAPKVDGMGAKGAAEGGGTTTRVVGDQRALAARGLPAMAGSCPEVYRERAVIEAGFAPMEPLPNARELGVSSLAFRVHPGIESRELQSVADAVAEVMAQATRPLPIELQEVAT